ncbi:MAG: hypothetical protein OXL37_04095 [Chloroflexota bacterium]|nr:hypothetical protein [Chloroflexota bacterium]MDE2958499.1 hypothetical protein [Chloroflexota bacterium]
MLLAVALNGCGLCNGLPLLGYLNELANREDGIIITATLLLFPTTATLYGVFRMFFAAKQAAERKARERERQERERERQTHERGRREGIKEGIIAGRQTERERINAALEQHGVQLTPELTKILSGDEE